MSEMQKRDSSSVFSSLCYLSPSYAVPRRSSGRNEPANSTLSLQPRSPCHNFESCRR